MRTLQHLFENNRRWAEQVRERDPHFFTRLAQRQLPQYLWIGCSDSRVPANKIIDVEPGELFVHRNIANAVIHTDLNSLSVIQYAVEVLKVQHIIVCGHYGCGGVQAALEDARLGLIDNWLRHVQEVRNKHQKVLREIEDGARRLDTLCELNVIEQVENVTISTVVRNAWASGQALSVHGWIYRLADGLLHDLSFCVRNDHERPEIYQTALERILKTS